MICRDIQTRGFTLLEVMVALAVLAIAIAALWKGMVQGFAVSEGLPERMVAGWVANNLLVELQANEQWPNTRVYSGTALMKGRLWYWQHKVSSTEEPMLRRVTISVGSRPDALTLFSLEGYLRRPRPPVSLPKRIINPDSTSHFQARQPINAG